VSWHPEQYARFAAERAQPFHDLCDLIHPVPPGSIGRAVDLGCGSGSLTVLAAERFGVEEMVGLDSSSEMLAEAEAIEQERVRFAYGDLSTWTADADHDLVLANASLQWVPDHRAVLARWVAALSPGGQLAVQVPANADHPSHLALVAVAHTEPFRSAFDGEPPPDPVAANVLAPEQYATILHDLGMETPHVRLQVYGHVLDSSAAVVEWTRGTSLTRFWPRLPAALHDPFVDAYRDALLERIGEVSPYFFAFKRILMWARSPRQPRG